MAQNDLDATLVLLEALLKSSNNSVDKQKLLNQILNNYSLANSIIERSLEVDNRYLIAQINLLYPGAIVKHRLSSSYNVMDFAKYPNDQVTFLLGNGFRPHFISYCKWYKSSPRYLMWLTDDEIKQFESFALEHFIDEALCQDNRDVFRRIYDLKPDVIEKYKKDKERHWIYDQSFSKYSDDQISFLLDHGFKGVLISYCASKDVNLLSKFLDRFSDDE